MQQIKKIEGEQMRDTYLGLNQKNVLILKDKFLDGKGESQIKTEDLILIRRLQDFIASSKTVQVIVDNNIYSWVHYEIIQEDLPMIFPSVVSVKKRVEKLRKLGLIINKAHKVNKEMLAKDDEDGFDKPGVYSVIKLSKQCRKLFDFSNMEKVETVEITPEEQEGFYHEGVKGLDHNGVMGQHHEGVKGYHHNGVNKEYQEINTKKENTTTTNYKEPEIVIEPEKNSSSVSEEIKKLKKYLTEHIQDIPTCKNIMFLAENRGLTLERIQTVVEYSKKNKKGNGYIYSALENNWDIPTKKAVVPSPVPTKKKQTLGEQELKDSLPPEEREYKELEFKTHNIIKKQPDLVKEFYKIRNLSQLKQFIDKNNIKVS